MDWNVKNAVNRDVERQHLNKILKEIRDTVSSVSGNGLTEQQVKQWIAESQVPTVFPPSPVVTVTLEGDVVGSGSGRTSITIPTTLTETFVEEAPLDGLPYWRAAGGWEGVPLSLLSLSFLENSGFPSYNADLLEYSSRTMTGSAGRITVANGDGILGDPVFDLATVADSGTGALLAITKDGYGRITGSKPATITPVAGQTVVTNGNAVAGLPTIGLATVADGGVAPTLLKVTRDTFGRVNNTQAATATDVPIAKLGAATWDNVQEYINVMNSPGLVEGGSFTDAGGGNLTYTSMRIAIRPTDSDSAVLYMADVPGGSIAIPNDSVTRFIGIQYNAGVPNVVSKTADSWDYDTEFPLGEVVNLGGTLFALFNPYKVGDPITNIIQRFDAQAYAIRSSAGGLELSTDGTTRNLAMTAGIIWTRLNDHTVAARNSPTVPLFRVAPAVGVPPLLFTPGITAWPNTEYVNGTTITTMGNNKWAVLYVFVNVGTGAWGFAHGTAEYNNSSGAAGDLMPAYLTPNFLRQNLFVGRLLFQKSATTAIIESAFTRVFSTEAVTDHNQLGGLQGGTLNEYYHLTAAQLATVNTSVQSVVAGSGISVNNTNPRVPIVSALPSTIIGTYAARPVAAPANSGVTYVATDVHESYISNGTAWTLLPGAGVLLAAAERITPFTTTSGSPVDIPGMVVSFIAGERPFMVEIGADVYCAGAPADLMAVPVLVDGVAVTQLIASGASPNYIGMSRQVVITGKVPGTLVTCKMQCLATGGSTANVFGDPTDKAALYVRNI